MFASLLQLPALAATRAMNVVGGEWLYPLLKLEAPMELISILAWADLFFSSTRRAVCDFLVVKHRAVYV